MINTSFCFREKKYLSVAEAAEIRNCTRQTLYYAIRTKNLKANRINYFWSISYDDLMTYEKNLYSRMFHSRHNGKRVFSEKKGKVTVGWASSRYDIPKQHFYYAIRKKRLKSKKVKGAVVLDTNDIRLYIREYLKDDKNIPAANFGKMYPFPKFGRC